MLRIAHISDLHFEDNNARDTNRSILKWLAENLGQEIFKAKIELRSHNPDKFNALENIFRWLQPKLILVTGDITNFGDTKSFEFAARCLKKLKEAANADQVLCVPGNHDTLVERAGYLRKKIPKKFAKPIIKRLFLPGNRHIKFNQLLSNIIENGDDYHFLHNYQNIIEPEFGSVDPSRPIVIDTRWGKAVVFLFNSTNEAVLMANEGHVGERQFNALNTCIQNNKSVDPKSQTLRIAILHHHPISAPGAYSSPIERGFNWMKDGPRFLDYMNHCGFQLVLHGHEHTAFQCTINYENRPGGVNVIAAGTAIQGDDPGIGSFNIIEQYSPFEARLKRFDYTSTGYKKYPQFATSLEIQSRSLIRITKPGEIETPEDSAVRNLFDIQPEAFDENHSYESFDYKVEIDNNQLYKGLYRRKGKVVGEEYDRGPMFILTGSPGMKSEDMELEAMDNNTDQKLHIEFIIDELRQKIIRVLHQLELAPQQEFDISLKFKWQASNDEPHHFDGLNLMYFLHPIERLKYQAYLPWSPKQPRTRAYAPEGFKPEVEQKIEELEQGFLYTVSINKPKSLPYLFFFEPAII
jgi:3',5'-cyclic AMP phosphodiesterase CpdA